MRKLYGIFSKLRNGKFVDWLEKDSDIELLLVGKKIWSHRKIWKKDPTNVF